MRPSTRYVATAVLSLGLAACAGNKIKSDLGIKGAPDWVNEGTQAINDKDGRLLHGVGMAPPMGDTSLQKATAENRARTEIARVLSTFIDATIDDYTASLGDTADASVAREIESTTQLALTGARIIGAWKDKRTDNIYAAAQLDLQTLKRSLATANQLSGAFKDYFELHGDAAFDRFMRSQRSTEDRQL